MLEYDPLGRPKALADETAYLASLLAKEAFELKVAK